MKSFRAAPVSLLLAALALGAVGCSPKKDQAPPQPKVTAAAKGPAAPMAALPVLGVAPAWKLQDLNGAAVTSEQLKGKVVVVDFWATWCPPCREEIPGYIALQKKYGPDGVAFVGVSVDEAGPGVVKEFAAKFGINYQMLMASDAVIAAFGGVEAYPTTFLIDRNGMIRDRKVGSEPTEDYEQKIKALLFAPAWKLQDVNGAPVTSEQLKGKVVVLDFWATWCPPCREEIPGYIALQKKYGQDGVAFVGVSLDQAGPGVVKEFAAKFGINYQMLMADDAVIAAFGGVEAIPTTFLIDRSGKIRDRKVGSEPTADYEQKIKALLN